MKIDTPETEEGIMLIDECMRIPAQPAGLFHKEKMLREVPHEL